MRALLKSPLLIALTVALLCVLTEFTQLPSHIYWNVWFKNAAHHQSSEAAVVSLDDGGAANGRSLVNLPGEQAKLLDAIVAQGARRVYLDVPVFSGTDSRGEAALDSALQRHADRIRLVERAHVSYDGASGAYSVVSRSRFVAPVGVKTLVSAWELNGLAYASRSPVNLATDKGALATVAASNLPAGTTGKIFPDFRLSPLGVPLVDAKQLVFGATGSSVLRGRDVFVTSTNPTAPSALGFFGHASNIPAAYVDIAALDSHTVRQPLELGELPLLAVFAALIGIGQRLRRRRAKIAIYVLLVGSICVAPGILRDFGIIVEFGAAMIAVVLYAPIRSSQKWRSRVQLTSSASGLPNIEALTRSGVAKSQDVVAASISQYEQMLASLPHELHGECARQIARRLSLGAGDREVFDCDNGHFVWLENSRTLDEIVGHLEGLRALFSSPLVIGGHVLDTTIQFGLDRNVDSRPVARVQSALASVGEAQTKGKLYEEFGHQRLAQSPWELSLHARIDEGLRNGDIWLALQPQFDFRHNRISGAEALIRWNDPERGVIPPDAFILQAERAGRIEAITYWVLEKSIAMSHALNRMASPFQISVNLSARMVDHPALVSRISDIVRTHPIDCSLITLEVTETFSMANREEAKKNLSELRAMGFRLSIDDFGTGQASLAYLAEIPSDEIKLDRRFVQAITSDPRERCIVDSVIRLAHDLGQEVVAEGIEDATTLEELRRLNCDLAQGYYVGRPVRFEEFTHLLAASQINTASG
jgi:EAL domain-containing protein (putative c-di-GMP-specific phosphodiesterase class I)